MGRFTVIPTNAFEGLQLDAGVLLRRFNPLNPIAPADEDIICATTGGINATCVPTYSDFGEDVDNVPNNMMEFKHLDSWECKFSTTSLGTSPALLKLALGCADIDGDNASKVVPRADLKQTDFSDIWWVGDRADGGMVAIQLKNALSTAGFSIQTTKNGKGTIALEITGHVSINAQKEVPMVFYSSDPDETAYWNVTQILSHVTSTFTERTIDANTQLVATITPDDTYVIENITVLMGGEDITDSVLVSDTITITSVTGDVQIVATAVAGA